MPRFSENGCVAGLPGVVPRERSDSDLSDLSDFTWHVKQGTNGLFGCDFYALSNYSDHVVTPPVLAPDGWIAWQYHNGSSAVDSTSAGTSGGDSSLCASERGVVLAFRRASNGRYPPDLLCRNISLPHCVIETKDIHVPRHTSICHV